MARSASGRTRGRSSGRSGKSGRTHPTPWGIEVFGRPEHNRFWLTVGFLLRRRAELTTLTLIGVTFGYVEHHVDPVLPAGMAPAQGAGLIMTTTLVVVLVVPVTRRYVLRRCWAVMTRHRMRACFYQTRTWTTNGRMPFLLWSRPSPVGERVRVWLPAGLSVKHLERIDDELAAACWAREVRITLIREQAALVIVEIIRHDPLGTARPLTPPVVDHLDAVDTATGRPVWLPAPDELQDPAADSAPATSGPAAGSPITNGTQPNGVKPNGTKPGAKGTGPGAVADRPADPPAVTGFGGEDVSDYI